MNGSYTFHALPIWTTALALALLFFWVAGWPTRSFADLPVQYRTLTLPFPPPPALLQSKLEEYGNEGWELVFVIQQNGTLIFKR